MHNATLATVIKFIIMNAKRKITPLGARVLISIEEEPTKTKSGIFIAETVSKDRPEQGKVIAVGEGRTTDDGKVIPMKIKVGDTILFLKYGLDEVKVDGGYYLVSEANILGIIK